MMLALLFTKSFQSLGRTATAAAGSTRFNAEEIGRKAKTYIRLMLMMLALRCTNSTSITGSNCCGCRGFNGREIGQRA